MARSGKATSSSPRKSSAVDLGVAVALAVAAFVLYLPSLGSDFVYDGHIEILSEGFVTSLSNLPAVLSFQVLGMPLMLGDRPGQLLFLMFEAAIWGKDPWGYHLCSSLLHAANVALLYLLLRRLVAAEWPDALAARVGEVRAGLIAVTLIFAAHPLSVETVAAVNYSSDELVALFTLLALFAAIRFQPGRGVVMGILGTLCAFAAVTCKESGLACALILAVYWFLYRRGEARTPWLWFLGAASMVTLLFLVARFAFAPAATKQVQYLGGSFGSVFLIQPRLWVLMFFKLVWPTGQSADYTLGNVSDLPLGLALPILLLVLAFQAWLATRSRLGALGVALFWLSLATVSNLTPLFRILADRFYYVPLAALAMQVTALLLMTRVVEVVWTATGLLLVAVVPFTILSLERQPVFASDLALWTDTLEASPDSSLAQNNVAEGLLEAGQLDDSIAHAQLAIQADPTFASAYNNLGCAMARKGQLKEALPYFQKAVQLDPNQAEAHHNLASDYLTFGRNSDAMAEETRALEIRPQYPDAHCGLGTALMLSGRFDEAIEQFQLTLQLDPRQPKAHLGLGLAYFHGGRLDEAIAEYQASLTITPMNPHVHNDLGVALMQKGLLAEAEEQFNIALQLDPGNRGTLENLAAVHAKQHPAADATGTKPK